MNYLVLILLMLAIVQAQKPCAEYSYNESDCIGSKGNSCLWNEVYNSCEDSSSDQIGCNYNLNEMACLSQLLYPDQTFAYCRFSGYCRQIKSEIQGCSKDFSVPACYSVSNQDCIFSEYCQASPLQRLTDLTIYQNYNQTILSNVNVFVCQSIRIYPVIHSYGKQKLIEGLIESYRETNVTLAKKYQQMQVFLGCIQPDDLILSQLLCSDSGINIRTCTIITTQGQYCQFMNGKCNNVKDSSILNCQDNLNIWACLSVTKFTQPCYWNDAQKICLKHQITSQTQCDTFKLFGIRYKNSPSFCSANIYQTMENGKVVSFECFFDPQRFTCNQMCRGILMAKNIFKKSVYGCSFVDSDNVCIFKHKSSQCSLPGQNQYSCMNANEPCQFVNGFCKPFSTIQINNLQCTQGLNKFACVNVSNLSQTCQFIGNQCIFIGLDEINAFDEEVDPTQPIIQPKNMNVNPNVCRKLVQAIRYFVLGKIEDLGNCFHSVNPACTLPGLNKLGCLTTTYNINPCIWNPLRGQCQDLIVNSTTSCQDLIQVNPYSCTKVTVAGQICGYKSPNCMILSLNDDLRCDYPGLNRLACISITKFACRFYQNQCQLIANEITQGLMCNGLESVTQQTCLLISTNQETCYYDKEGYRCSADVTPSMPCNQPGLNKYGCSFLYNEKVDVDCHFNKVCVFTQTFELNTINCITDFPSQSVCKKITTPGQQCQWNTYKNICNPPKYPTNQNCVDIKKVNQNACLGYTTVQSVNPNLHYCQYDDTNKACIIFSDTPISECNFAQKVNIYPCVAIQGNNCYFERATMLCTKLTDTISPNNLKILNKIVCLQANYDLCSLVTTPGQKCVWNSDQKICEFQDQQQICDTKAVNVNPNYCENTDDTNACYYDNINKTCSKIFKSVIRACEGLNLFVCLSAQNSACYYDMKLRDCQSVTLPNNLDCLSQFNQSGCNMAMGNPLNIKGCKWYQDKCQISEQTDFNMECSNYIGIIECASSINQGCEFNLVNFICQQTLAYDYDTNPVQNPVCQIGRNLQACNSQQCNFTDDKLCISSNCSLKTSDVDCMAIKNEACTFIYENNNYGAGSCLGSKFLITTQCSDYEDKPSNFRQIYNQQTCLSVNECQAQPFKNILSQIIGNKCRPSSSTICLTSISRNECKQVQNDCLWNDIICYQRPNTSVINNCSDYFSKYGCKNTKFLFYENQQQVGCQWDNFLCKEYLASYNCDSNQNVSQSQCYQTTDSIKNCYYNKDKQDCDTFTNIATTCTDAKNQFQCSSVAANCWWDPDNLICSLFTSISQAATKTCQQLFFSNKDLCLASNIEGEMCQFTESCGYSDPLMSKCTDQLNIFACAGVAVLGEKCAYTNKCGVADLNNAKCTDSLNIYGCVGIVTNNQYCIWMGRQCAPFTNDGITQDSQSLINALVCTKAYTINGLQVTKLPAVGVKYSSDTFGCQPSDPTIDACTTPGMNYYACLNSQVGSCTWDKINKKCANFVDPGTFATCEQYLNVSSKVCQQITKTGLKCQSTQDGCSTMTSTSLCNQNLNKLACLTQTIQPCQWLNNTCVLQNVLFGVVSCVPTIAGQPFLNPLSSPLSCSNINYNNQICYYDPVKQGCITQFDPLVFTCNTPGLNVEGCIQIKNQSCQFQNGYCLQLSQLGPTDCGMLRNVSQLTCAQLENGQQTCKASVFQGICLSVGLTDLCSTSGINQSGCQSLSQCLWNPDSSKCLCVQFNQSLKFCNGVSKSLCLQNQSCIWKQFKCQRYSCEDQIDCNGMVNGQTCFLNIYFQCKSAQTCYDISYVNDCTKYTINGVKCQLYINGYCQPEKCIHLTSEIYCNGYCKWNGQYCQNQECQFLSKQQCYGSYFNLGCGWYMDSCHGYSQCEQISTLSDTQINLQQLCNTIQINEVKCIWQKTLSGQSYECSSNQCRLFKDNKIICQGREVGFPIKNQVCVLDNVYKCVSCEMIKDDCLCAQYVGYCTFQSGKCKSILCSSFQTVDSCGTTPKKCLWNIISKQCVMGCQKYDKQECDALSNSTQLCYYNQITQQCLEGQENFNSVDTISPQLIQNTIQAAFMISFYIIV